jgi:hypothetical protein
MNSLTGELPSTIGYELSGMSLQEKEAGNAAIYSHYFDTLKNSTEESQPSRLDV